MRFLLASLFLFFITLSYASEPVIHTDVVVVGAGYSGLLAARTVARAGYHVVILEARNRVGGRALSVPVSPGVVADLGAGWVISPTHAHMIALAKEYGVALYPTYIQGDGLVMEGNQVHRVSMDELSFSPDHPPATLKAAADVINRLIKMSHDIDPNQPWLYPAADKLDNMTFLEWFKKNYSHLDAQNTQIVERTIESYIGPLSTTSFLNVLTYTNMSHGLKNYADMKNWLRVEGGVAHIAQKISEELKKNSKVNLFLNNQVFRIDQSTTHVVVYATHKTVEAQYVIVAIPPAVANGINFRQNDTPVIPRGGGHEYESTHHYDAGF